ncbi:hypothetical protein [Propioniciclava sinopodophylli]|jgi:hypothetical protein|nr:hypothetical protein [Propioniciclava sinopodophylli]
MPKHSSLLRTLRQLLATERPHRPVSLYDKVQPDALRHLWNR